MKSWPEAAGHWRLIGATMAKNAGRAGVRRRGGGFRTVGKPAKVAIVAIMRKLIEMANALVKADRMWTPKTA